ncbi:2-amino-4-hydroxy-6-hydroxymethyldihydropteridine diphosphokinase [Candidatus Peregrinibacteria bacterium]|jgi:2-amino-4-hydroxy-6-hydroxymethyldihydropteridine diphosphokinase|nr:2-amino-4-hydroxy-6-hydroxymethyldihydropteridine diphosphokinase [Candidatus Peregrinibacteria bacterium]
MNKIYLCLGSNLGDKSGNLGKARFLLEENGLKIVKDSSILETEPWGIESQPNFLNQVLKVEFSASFRGERSSYALLYICQQVEKTMGKTMKGDENYTQWGERIIDIDILQYEDTISWDPDLILPHHTFEKEYVKALIKELSS